MKKLPPIIVTIIFSAYICVYIGMALFTKESSFIGRLFLSAIGIGAVCMLAAMIVTLITRLKEIDKEDKDDLSKY